MNVKVLYKKLRFINFISMNIIKAKIRYYRLPPSRGLIMKQ